MSAQVGNMTHVIIKSQVQSKQVREEEVGEIRISTMPFISDSFLRPTNRFIFSSAFSTTCRDLNGEEIMMI